MKVLLSKLYALAATARIGLYRSGVLRSKSLRQPVVSVGNLTMGGTGKTPYVAYLARLLKASGRQPIILSRGYRGRFERSNLIVSDGGGPLCDPRDCGDEPYLLARKLEGVPVVVGKNRHRSGRLVEDRFAEAVHLLDDGFQHLALRRDLDILLLDATDPFGGGLPPPAGRLREPLPGLARADLVVVTRAHFSADFRAIEETVRRWNPSVPISYFHHDAVSLHDLKTGERRRVRDFLNRPAVALAAVGNPDVLLRDLAHYQIRVTARFLHRDHHDFTQGDLDRALEAAGSEACVITTEKDAVKLRRLETPPGRVMVFEIEAVPEDPPEYERFVLDEIAELFERREAAGGTVAAGAAS